MAKLSNEKAAWAFLAFCFVYVMVEDWLSFRRWRIDYKTRLMLVDKDELKRRVESDEFMVTDA